MGSSGAPGEGAIEAPARRSRRGHRSCSSCASTCLGILEHVGGGLGGCWCRRARNRSSLVGGRGRRESEGLGVCMLGLSRRRSGS